MSSPRSGPGVAWLWPALAVVIATGTVAEAGESSPSHAWALVPLPDLRATDQAGHPAMIADFRGRWVVVFFGYTRCPDVCPAGLSELSRAVAELGPGGADIQPLFITLDPARDRPKTLAGYLRSFHPRLAGFVYSEADLGVLARAFRVLYSGPDAGGAIDHTGFFYLITPAGLLDRNPLLPPLSVDDLKARIDAPGGRH